MCNILIYFCNILMKYLRHTSKIFEMYACNMHPISVQPPSSSAWGHRSHSRRRGGGLLHQGPTLLLARRPQWLAGGRGRGSHARVQRCSRRQAKRATEQKQQHEAAGRRGGAGEGAAWGDCRRRSRPQSRSSGVTDGVGAGGVTIDAWSKAEEVSRLILLSLSN
jgi:hypothetical protein